jgi:hypothetical protein
MTRPAPVGRPVLTDQEIEAQARSEGKSEDEIAALLSARKANREALQAAYDVKPPSNRFVAPRD